MAGFSSSTSSQGTKVIPEMLGVYNQLLGLNQSNYNNILNAYAQGSQRLDDRITSITRSYGDVYEGIKDTLGVGGGGWGVAKPAAEAIERSYAANRGRTQQGMINAGLGNTTVLANLANQDTQQAAQAYGGLGAQLADKAAGYAAQLGLAQHQAAMQGLGMQTGLTQAYMGDLAGYKFQNTAGDLTGTYSNSSSMSSGGGGGGGRGGGGSAMGGPFEWANQYGGYGAPNALGAAYGGGVARGMYDPSMFFLGGGGPQSVYVPPPETAEPPLADEGFYAYGELDDSWSWVG